MNVLHTILLIAIIFISNTLFAQNGIGFEAQVYFGKIIKHNPTFEPEITSNTLMYELSIIRKSKFNQLWESLHNHPQVGIAFMYSDYNQPEIFGKAYSVFPHLRLTLIEKNRSIGYLRLGSGLSWLNKPFDVIENPTNNVIGSHLNNVSQIKFGYVYTFNEQVQANLGFGLTHFSNSSVRKPNLGINVIAAKVGLQYVPQPILPKERLEDLPSYNSSIRYHVRTSLALSSVSPPGGPTYPVYILNFGIQKQLSLKNIAGIGIEAEQNRAIKDFISQQEIFTENLNKNSSRVQAFLYDEFIFGKIGLSGQMGYYIFAPFRASSDVTFKIGAQYYVLDHYRHTRQLYIGAFLKSHLSVAAYYEMGVGYVF